MSKVASMLEIRFSDNMRFQISLTLMISHYQKNESKLGECYLTKKKEKFTKDELLKDPDLLVDYATKYMNWSECILSAVGVSIDVAPDYDKEFSHKGNKKIIFIEGPNKAEMERDELANKKRIEANTKALETEENRRKAAKQKELDEQEAGRALRKQQERDKIAAQNEKARLDAIEKNKKLADEKKAFGVGVSAKDDDED